MNKHNLSQLSVLVVDDLPSLRDFIKAYLVIMGVGRIQTAKSGKEALTKLRTEKFQLILSDAMMPDMDGVSLLAAVRDNAATSSIPFVIISAFPEKALVSAAAKGVSDFILKPFSYELFSEKINTVLLKSGFIESVPG